MSLITVTPAANTQISKLCEENKCHAITLNLKGGGCAGFEYEWGTAQVEDLNDDDYVIECDIGSFAVAAYSLMFLAGSEVDYVTSLVGSNFEIKNPNTQSACGCGVSVNFDVDTLPDLSSSAV